MRAFEVRKVNHPVIVEQVGAHNVILYVGCILYRDSCLGSAIEQVNWCNGGKAMILEHLQVALGLIAWTGICSVALHNGTVHLAHKVLD